MLTLKKALEKNRLQEFIAQETKRGVGPASADEVETAIAALIKSKQSKDRTSRSASRGYSREK